MSTGIDYLDEVWKEVPGYRDYFVSDFGRIKGPGKGHNGGQIMNPMRSIDGYLYILTKRPEVPRKLFIHRAVLLAFVGPCPEGMESRHKNGKPSQNLLDNLAWGTRVEQREDERRHGTRCIGEKSGTAKLTEKAVLEIRKRIKTTTARALSKEHGVSHTTILRAVNGHYWGHI